MLAYIFLDVALVTELKSHHLHWNLHDEEEQCDGLRVVDFEDPELKSRDVR